MNMDQGIKARWTAALRSGDYGQTTGTLRRGDDFCCLGVLCDIAVKDGVIEEPTAGEVSNTYWYEGHSAALPLAVVEWSGIVENDPTPETGARGNPSLAELNDDYGLTFPQIADVIDYFL
ncbi:hypothetical protein O7614_26780 [Micromonospora sp. WMMD961]|uniref:hypothetical protein n=1 Tax=Micromonospora sp. WMMD961 TaxID=3016100 RepID=UPI00241712E6|nr:hypothetical protein [Micromonospora sp. WMMD961]MDG4783270.1 hypothetical protein [Micromonospora sp. WMMD961]